MKRNEVKEQRTWDLSGLFNNDKEWEVAFEQMKDRLNECEKFNGKLGEKKMLLGYLQTSSEMELAFMRLYGYSHMKNDQDQSDAHYTAMQNRIESLLMQFNTKVSFVAPQLSNLDEKYLLDCINDKDFSDFDYMLKGVLRNKKYILSEKEERILALSREATDGYNNIFTMINNVEIPFGEVTMEDGKKVKLSHGMYSVMLQNPNKDIRRQAYEGIYTAFKSLTRTLAASLSGYVKANIFRAEAKGFESPLASALNANDVPRGVYDNLISSINKNLSPMHDYVALRKKILNLETLNMYDMYVPIVENAEIKMDYDKAYELVIEGLKPLGSEYNKLLKQAYADRWIDVEETEGKCSGAYCSGVARPHPFVLLNYQETTHDVFTIAHEMGHAMHSHFSIANQPVAKSDYSIFVAEVASTVNEILLLKHLIGAEKNVNVKKFLLSYYLDMFRTTLYRQTMFAEFEKIMHDLQAGGQPLTSEVLSEKYLELNRKYYGEAVVHDDFIKYEWSRIPHFYFNFYVYQYSTGITSAVNIAYALLSEGESALKRYMQFLSSGGCKSPYEILKDCGVDLMTSAPFDVVMKEFADTLAELEKLVK